jgi:hypothetical protein
LAERELTEAARFYEARAVGLGADFIHEVEHALAQIVANPEAGSALAGTIIRRWSDVSHLPFCTKRRLKTCR